MIYQIKQTSIFLHVVALLIAIGLGSVFIMPIVTYFVHQKHPNALLLYVIPLAILYPLITYIPRYLSSVTVKLYITPQGLEQRWLQHFIFKKKQDMIIPWAEIDEYVNQPGYRFDHFKLYLRNGTILHLVHNHEHDKDDFRSFVKDFLEQVAAQNAGQHATAIRQGRKDHVGEIRVMTVMLISFALFVPFMLLIYKQKEPIPMPKYIMMWVVGIFVMWVFLKKIQQLKRDV